MGRVTFLISFLLVLNFAFCDYDIQWKDDKSCLSDNGDIIESLEICPDLPSARIFPQIFQYRDYTLVHGGYGDFFYRTCDFRDVVLGDLWNYQHSSEIWHYEPVFNWESPGVPVKLQSCQLHNVEASTSGIPARFAAASFAYHHPSMGAVPIAIGGIGYESGAMGTSIQALGSGILFEMDKQQWHEFYPIDPLPPDDPTFPRGLAWGVPFDLTRSGSGMYIYGGCDISVGSSREVFCDMRLYGLNLEISSVSDTLFVEFVPSEVHISNEANSGPSSFGYRPHVVSYHWQFRDSLFIFGGLTPNGEMFNGEVFRLDYSDSSNSFEWAVFKSSDRSGSSNADADVDFPKQSWGLFFMWPNNYGDTKPVSETNFEIYMYSGLTNGWPQVTQTEVVPVSFDGEPEFWMGSLSTTDDTVYWRLIHNDVKTNPNIALGSLVLNKFIPHEDDEEEEKESLDMHALHYVLSGVGFGGDLGDKAKMMRWGKKVSIEWSLGTWEVVGIVAGSVVTAGCCVCVIVAVVVGIWLSIRKKKKKRKSNNGREKVENVKNEKKKQKQQQGDGEEEEEVIAMKSIKLESLKSRTKFQKMIAELELEKYTHNFTKCGVVWKDLDHLEESDILELVPDSIPRKRFQRYIDDLKLKREMEERDGGDIQSVVPMTRQAPTESTQPTEVNSNTNEKDEKQAKQKNSENQPGGAGGGGGGGGLTQLSGWNLDKSLVTIGKVIKSGSFGIVRAGSLSLGLGSLKVAVKEIPLGEGQSARDDVIHEVKIMSEMKHNNVLQCFGCWFEEQKGTANIVMDLCEKGDLYSFKKKKKMKPQNIMSIILQIAKGMSYIHSKNLIHRDLKTQNILLTKDNVVKICDFGTSKHTTSVNQTFCGTVEYLAPEQYNTQLLGDPQLIDVYAFGIIIWELWSQQTPFSILREECNNNQFELLQKIHGEEGRRPNTDALGDSMPEELMELMEACWSKEPSERPDSFSSIVDDLKEIQSHMLNK